MTTNVEILQELIRNFFKKKKIIIINSTIKKKNHKGALFKKVTL